MASDGDGKNDVGLSVGIGVTMIVWSNEVRVPSSCLTEN